MTLLEKLLTQLDQIKFRVDDTNMSRNKIHDKNSQVIHFTYRNQTYQKQRKAVYQPTEGIMKHPNIYKTLKDIAKEYFPEFSYNWIQVSKNVKTNKHKDKGNKGMLYTFTVGNFKGGELMTEKGGIDTHDKPTIFDGKNITHWTGDWEGGDRYCCIYFTNRNAPPEKSKKAIEILKPESRTDFLTINEIFRYDIYKTNLLVKEGETWIDIGGNIGAFNLKCLDLGVSKVFTYEPCKRNFDKLHEVFGDNEKVSLHRCAVSDFEGETPLYLERNGDWRHTIYRKILRRDTETVPVIDALNLPPCDGMKLDCEGSEVDIIKRLKVFPKKLVLEYDGKHRKLKKDYVEFTEFLKTKYNTVECQELVEGVIDFWPNGLNIRCWGLKSPSF